MSEAKILIVEDEAISAMDIQQRLKALGYPLPDIAYNGEEGVWKVEETQPDLVLMDIMMPGKMDGIAAAEQIRTRFDVPVIFLTAYTDEATLNRAKITAPYGYIIKPFQERELHITVDMALYRHKMERELKEREKLNRLLIENIKDYAIFLLDPGGRVLSWNDGAERLKGYTAEEIIGQHFSIFYPAEDAASGKPRHELETAMAEGRFEEEGLRVRKDGSQFWAGVLITALYDDAGTLRGFTKVTRDIAERKQAEEVLSKAHDEMQAANKSLRDSRLATLNMMEDALTASKEAEKVNAELQQEITERKKAEADVIKLSEDMAARNVELELANREMESFIYSISHDLRAPIRIMSGFAKVVIEDYKDKLDAQAQDYLERILKGSEKSTQLIDDLLRLSKISRQEIDRIEINLSSKASKRAEELRETERGRNVEFVVQEGLIALADPPLIELALSNLIENAWKFTSKMEKGKIEFGAMNEEISRIGLMRPISPEQKQTIYFIRDNGVGFNPAYADKMFWPFHRLHSDKEFEGTGIGLAIVERIIRRHGGKVWAEGEVGKGATVFFTLGSFN